VANVVALPTRTCQERQEQLRAGVQMFALIQQLIGSSGRHPSRRRPQQRLRHAS